MPVLPSDLDPDDEDLYDEVRLESGADAHAKAIHSHLGSRAYRQSMSQALTREAMEDETLSQHNQAAELVDLFVGKEPNEVTDRGCDRSRFEWSQHKEGSELEIIARHDLCETERSVDGTACNKYQIYWAFTPEGGEKKRGTLEVAGPSHAASSVAPQTEDGDGMVVLEA